MSLRGHCGNSSRAANKSNSSSASARLNGKAQGQYPLGNRRSLRICGLLFTASHSELETGNHHRVHLWHALSCPRLTTLEVIHVDPREILEAEVLKLAPAERARLLDRLLSSLDQDPEWARAWAQEADRREAEIAAGRATWLPGEEVVARLRTQLKWAISSRRRQRASLRRALRFMTSKPVGQ